MIKISRNTWPIYCVSILVSLVLLLLFIPLWSYRQSSFGLDSSIGDALAVFKYNESKHADPIKGCWYDSGDYIVFAQRNALSLYYLSLAYSHAEKPEVKQDLKEVIDQQYHCLALMMTDGYKQFRDQSSHGAIVPAAYHQILYPQNRYAFESGEGKDVALLLYDIAILTDRVEDGDRWYALAQKLQSRTVSAVCCEEGPIVLSDAEYGALNDLSYHSESHGNQGWGISLRSLLALQNGEYQQVNDILKAVKKEWDDRAYQFDYIGGNYDIAGTIALERLYAAATGDRSFSALSQSMYDYLHGKNAYHVDFTDYPSPHHPCGTWWGMCELHEALINGIDERRDFDLNRPDAWRMTEIQLVGQAQYILSYVLYNGL